MGGGLPGRVLHTNRCAPTVRAPGLGGRARPRARQGRGTAHTGPPRGV